MRNPMRPCSPVFCQLLLIALHVPQAIGAEPTLVDRGTIGNHPQQPQLAVDERGWIHLVYGLGQQVRYCRSEDGAKSFTQPISLPQTSIISLGMRRGPRIAVTEAAICVTFIAGKQGKGRDGDVQALRSVDGGTTWTGPVRVNDVADAAREGLHGMAAGPDGSLCCVWLDLRNGKTAVMASRSSEGGQSWGTNRLVYRSPDGSVCECCHPSVTYDAANRIHVLWRNALSGSRDMYVASSADRGEHFGPAVKLGSGTWLLNACPMDGGAIDTFGDTLYTAWRRDKTVYLVDGFHAERRLGDGEQPWIAATARGPYVLWLKKRGETAYLLAPGANAPLQLASRAADPVIVSGRTGLGPVVAAWESRDGTEISIRCQVINN